MSQEKVNKYKEEKLNRKKIIAKQKRNAAIRNSILSLVIVGFVAFVGYSVYKDYIYEEPTETEVATYSLSESEITSAWNAYLEQETSSEDATTSNETTSSEETTSAAE